MQNLTIKLRAEHPICNLHTIKHQLIPCITLCTKEYTPELACLWTKTANQQKKKKKERVEQDKNISVLGSCADRCVSSEQHILLFDNTVLCCHRENHHENNKQPTEGLATRYNPAIGQRRLRPLWRRATSLVVAPLGWLDACGDWPIDALVIMIG